MTIASVSGREVDFAAGPYGTMKAALIHYTQGLAYQLAAKGIRANSLSPGNASSLAACGRTSSRTIPSSSRRRSG